MKNLFSENLTHHNNSFLKVDFEEKRKIFVGDAPTPEPKAETALPVEPTRSPEKSGENTEARGAELGASAKARQSISGKEGLTEQKKDETPSAAEKNTKTPDTPPSSQENEKNKENKEASKEYQQGTWGYYLRAAEDAPKSAARETLLQYVKNNVEDGTLEKPVGSSTEMVLGLLLWALNRPAVLEMVAPGSSLAITTAYPPTEQQKNGLQNATQTAGSLDENTSFPLKEAPSELKNTKKIEEPAFLYLCHNFLADSPNFNRGDWPDSAPQFASMLENSQRPDGDNYYDKVDLTKKENSVNNLPHGTIVCFTTGNPLDSKDVFGGQRIFGWIDQDPKGANVVKFYNGATNKVENLALKGGGPLNTLGLGGPRILAAYAPNTDPLAPESSTPESPAKPEEKPQTKPDSDKKEAPKTEPPKAEPGKPSDPEPSPEGETPAAPGEKEPDAPPEKKPETPSTPEGDKEKESESIGAMVGNAVDIGFTKAGELKDSVLNWLTNRGKSKERPPKSDDKK